MREILPYNAIATRHQVWEQLVAGVGAAETDLTAETKDFGNFGVAGATRLADDINLAELAVIMSGDITSATIAIYAARLGGPAEKVCSIVAVPGAQIVGDHPVSVHADTRVYADTLTITGVWYDDIKTADAAGDDGVAKAMFDLLGRQYLLAIVTAIVYEGEDDVSVDVIFSGV